MTNKPKGKRSVLPILLVVVLAAVGVVMFGAGLITSSIPLSLVGGGAILLASIIGYARNQDGIHPLQVLLEMFQ